MTRTSTVTYDAANRVIRTATTEAGPGAGAPVAPVVTTYGPVTGRVTKQASVNGQGTVTAAVETTYDTLGRVVKYADGTGAVTSTTYDRYDKPTRVDYSNDTSTTYTYDRAVEPAAWSPRSPTPSPAT